MMNLVLQKCGEETTHSNAEWNVRNVATETHSEEFNQFTRPRSDEVQERSTWEEMQSSETLNLVLQKCGGKTTSWKKWSNSARIGMWWWSHNMTGEGIWGHQNWSRIGMRIRRIWWCGDKSTFLTYEEIWSARILQLHQWRIGMQINVKRIPLVTKSRFTNWSRSTWALVEPSDDGGT